MNPDTGHIHELLATTEEEAEREAKQKGLVRIPRDVARYLQKKTPEQRVEWYRELSRLTGIHPAARAPGESADDIRKWITHPKDAAAKAKSTKKPPMPSKYDKLPAADIDALVAYMQTLK